MTTFSDAVLADTPVLYLNCNESSGTTLADSSGNANNGIVSSPYQLQNAPMHPGTGASIKFSGGWISVQPAANLIPTGDYTIEFIVGFTSSAQGVIFGAFNSASPYNGPEVICNYDYNTATNSPGTILVRDSSSTAYALSIGSSIKPYNDGVLRHYVFVRRGLVFEAWVNGDKISTLTLPNLRNLTDSVPFYAMGRSGNVQTTNGTLDELAFYTHALSQDRIQLHARIAQALLSISGTAKLSNGVPANGVAARDWTTHENVQFVTPDSSGTYELWVPAGDYDVTAFGPAGYQPITHGPVSAA